MANRQMGEFAFKAGDQAYTLVMDMDAMEACEAFFSTPQRDVFFPEIIDKVNRGSIRHTKVFFCQALQRYHPGTTLEQTNQIVQLGGGYFGVGAQIAQGLSAAVTPDEQDLKTLGVDRNPPAAQGMREKARRRRGTGTASTDTVAASV